jgi:ABC-type multidrug transport system fused ATPase/permease subunit
MSVSGTFSAALPIISLYVFAGYRLLPAAQIIYSSFTQLTFTSPSIEKLYNDINNLNSINLDCDKGLLPLNKKISLNNICYSYPNASKTALKNISLSISVKNTIGLVGATGSGKTTVVDIILGLLEAQKGTLEIDGKIINKQNTQSWQRSIGYVPQNIYLSDDTVAANIAFGQDPGDIDKEKIQKASKIASLHDFVIHELPNKYETTIGERGVRLSGGQRQRIGIARALYFNPQVLILDEATSALDNITEKHVMDAVNNLGKDKTIILIAHRLSTVKNCDKIFLFEKGELKNEGTFDELINNNENFKKSVIN